MKRVRSSDLTIANLPKNRKELFFDLLSNRWTTLLVLSLICLLSLAPFLIFRYYNILITTQLSTQVTNGELSAQDALALLLQNTNIESMINIPLLAFAGIGLSGVMRIIKKLCFGQGLSIVYDFFQGIRENALHYVIIALLFSLLSWIGNYFYVASYGASFSAKGVFGLVPIALLVLFFLPIFAYLLTMTAIYKDKFFVKLRISAVCYVRSLPQTLLCVLCLASPLFLLLIGNSYVQLLMPLLYAMLLPALLLIWFLFCCHFFDKYINSASFPDLVRKGLY